MYRRYCFPLPYRILIFAYVWNNNKVKKKIPKNIHFTYNYNQVNVVALLNLFTLQNINFCLCVE
jgi:hypothetical protein